MGIDLPRDLGTERLSWRRMRLLIAHLPRESLTAVAVHGPPPVWGETEHLLASIVDTLRAEGWGLRATLIRLFTKSGDVGRQPKPMRRPGDPDTPPKRVVGVRALAKMMGAGPKKRRGRRNPDE